MNEQGKRRSGLKIMGQLIVLVKPLLHIMTAAIILGAVGYLCAIFLTILAGEALLKVINEQGSSVRAFIYANNVLGVSISAILIIMLILAVLRGLLHYAEQYCNHFIAFKLLAIIRHEVFAVLRKLCPAKLEGRDKGNLISIITTDIELLEVFYAHTISPIAIAVITSVIMTLFIGSHSVAAGAFALCAYIVIGIAIPLWNGKRSGNIGMEFRTGFGNLTSFVLDSLRGLDETIQYGEGEVRKGQLEERSIDLSHKQKELNNKEGAQRSLTNLMILIFSFGMLFLTLYLHRKGAVGFDTILICTISMMSSFGPVVALSNLSNNLNQTLASGERVLALLEETPEVEEVLGVDGYEDNSAGKNEDTGIYYKAATSFAGAGLNEVTFAYDDDEILNNLSFSVKKGEIMGIHGASGCGKSTTLKLLMRFWDVDKGEITISDKNIKTIPTKQLRDMQAYVTQETYLFNDTIAANIAIGNQNATREEIAAAAKKASVHDFINSLQNGYDTNVGELGDTLSGGERQRIGLARAFLHNAPLLLLDEPTSNLDALNEGIILKSLKEITDKTMVLVSHRKSTMNLADTVLHMENGEVTGKR